MSVRREHNRKRTLPYGKDFDDVLRRSKAFMTTTVYLYGNKTIYHDDFEIHPYNGMNGIIYSCNHVTPKVFKKPDGTRTFHWNININRWEEVKESE